MFCKYFLFFIDLIVKFFYFILRNFTTIKFGIDSEILLVGGIEQWCGKLLEIGYFNSSTSTTHARAQNFTKGHTELSEFYWGFCLVTQMTSSDLEDGGGEKIKKSIFRDIRRYYCDYCGICRSKKSLIRSHVLTHHKV